jgi:hypothetical protein
MIELFGRLEASGLANHQERALVCLQVELES